MQYKAINFRFLLVAVNILYYFLNGFEAADLSEAYKSKITNKTDLQPPVTGNFTNEKGNDLIFDGSIIANSISGLTENSVFRATKNNQQVTFELGIPNLEVTGTYKINGTDGKKEFSESSTFSLELEDFMYNDTLPFKDGSLQNQPVENDEKINYTTIHLALAKLRFDSEDDLAHAIVDIENAISKYLQNVYNKLLIEIANKLQTLLKNLNMNFDQLGIPT